MIKDLIQEIQEIFKQQISKANIEGNYFSFEEKISSPIELDQILLNLNTTSRFYFRSKERKDQYLGLGEALVFKSPDIRDLYALTKEWKTPWQFFGGMCFNPKKESSSEWLPFSPLRFHIPTLLLIERNKELKIRMSFFNSEGLDGEKVKKAFAQEIQTLFFEQEVSERSRHTGHFQLLPNKEEWCDMISKALGHIQSKEVYKVVLGRKRILKAKSPWDPQIMLDKLLSSKEESYLFYYQPSSDVAFISKSPEKLFALKGNDLTTEAIAGTRPRGQNEAQDMALETELASSSKEREEHLFVSRSIQRNLEELCTQYETCQETKVLKLQNVQHLYTGFKGKLKEQKTAFDLLEAFHPTPAVGGVPASSACKLLEDLEPFDRGLYAAPIGFIGKDEAEFAVGIRSALLSKDEIHIYSGAGIVEGSGPRLEWDETESKMLGLLRGLGEF